MTNNVTGCIVRIWNDDQRALKELGRWYEQEHSEVEVFPAPTGTATPARFCLRHVRSGSLDLTAWMHVVAADLEDMDSEGELPDLGPSLRIHIELVFAPPAPGGSRIGKGRKP